MTRINCVPVEELSREHLIAEYRELPRAFGLAARKYQKVGGLHHSFHEQEKYAFGRGHVAFFYTKLAYLSKRHAALVGEMVKRGYQPKMKGNLASLWHDTLPLACWGDWQPDEAAMALNRERLALRTEESAARRTK